MVVSESTLVCGVANIRRSRTGPQNRTPACSTGAMDDRCARRSRTDCHNLTSPLHVLTLSFSHHTAVTQAGRQKAKARQAAMLGARSWQLYTRCLGSKLCAAIGKVRADSSKVKQEEAEASKQATTNHQPAEGRGRGRAGQQSPNEAGQDGGNDRDSVRGGCGAHGNCPEAGWC